LLGTELVHEMRRLFLLLALAANLELHVHPCEDLDGGLADATERHGELRFDE
jgi:hypothetical protein